MRSSRMCTECVLLVFLSFLSSGATFAFAVRPAIPESYLIPAFGPKEGEVVQSHVNFRIHDANVMLAVGNVNTSGTGEYHINNLYNICFLQTGEGRLTQYDLEITRALGTLAVTYPGENGMGPTIDAPFHSSLEGRTVRFTLEENEWRRSMIGADPSLTQEEEIANIEGWSQSDWNLPEERIASGHSWTFDASPLFRYFFGKRSRSSSGKGTLIFEATEEFEGEQCARIGIKANGVFEIREPDGRRTEVNVDVSGKLYLNLASGLEKKILLKGKADLVYESADSGNSKVRMRLSGPMEFISLSRLQDQSASVKVDACGTQISNLAPTNQSR